MNRDIREKIRNDELHYETTLKNTAERIVRDMNIKLVLITGGSCAGKTTTTRKLSELINASGRTAHTVSLDDYYRNPEESVYLPDGTRDIESINSLRVDMIREAFTSLLLGRETPIPMYDFKKARRTDGYRTITLNKGEIALSRACTPLICSFLRQLPTKAKYTAYIFMPTQAMTPIAVSCAVWCAIRATAMPTRSIPTIFGIT